jgi:hypothetical protein
MAANRVSFDHIPLAEAGWKKALQAADRAGIPRRNFPVDLNLQIEPVRAGVIHPSTKLPMGRWTADVLRKALRSRDWAIGLLRINDFNRFVATNASQEAPILLFAAQQLQKACAGLLDEEVFIGHLEHRGQDVDPNFVVVVGRKRAQAARRIVEDAAAKFNARANLFAASGFDQGSTLPVQAVCGVVAVSPEAEWMDFHQLLDRLSGPLDEGEN